MPKPNPKKKMLTAAEKQNILKEAKKINQGQEAFTELKTKLAESPSAIYEVQKDYRTERKMLRIRAINDIDIIFYDDGTYEVNSSPF